MKTFLKPTFNAIVEIENKKYDVMANTMLFVPTPLSRISITGEHTKNCFFLPYLLNQGTIKNLTNQLNYKNEYELIELRENMFIKNNYDLMLYTSENIKVRMFTKGKSCAEVNINHISYFHNFDFVCFSPSCFVFPNYIVYKSLLECGYCHVLVFCISSNSFIYDVICFQVDVTNNVLFVLDLPVSVGSAICHEFDLMNNFNIISVYPLKTTEQQKQNEITVPILFFDAVKTNYFSYALNSVSLTLKQYMSEETLTSFFQPYTKIIQNPFVENKKSFLLQSGKELHEFQFNVDESNLIDNIDKI